MIDLTIAGTIYNEDLLAVAGAYVQLLYVPNSEGTELAAYSAVIITDANGEYLINLNEFLDPFGTINAGDSLLVMSWTGDPSRESSNLERFSSQHYAIDTTQIVVTIDSMIIINLQPETSFEVPTRTKVGETITIVNNSSDDHELTANLISGDVLIRQILEFQGHSVFPVSEINRTIYDFGNGTVELTVSGNGGAEFSYFGPGSFVITITSYDKNGKCSVDTFPIIVKLREPELSITICPDECYYVGEELQFTPVISAPDNNILCLAWEIYDGGNSQSLWNKPLDEVQRHTFISEGRKAVSLIAKWTDGKIEQETRVDEKFDVLLLRELQRQTQVSCPRNVVVRANYQMRGFDLTWDIMSQIDPSICGYNVYRSQFEADHTFRLITPSPIGINFHRDSIEDGLITENVTKQYRSISKVNKVPNDDFFGEVIDRERWEVDDPLDAVNQRDNALFVKTNASGITNIRTKFFYVGDMEAEIKMYFTSFPVFNTPEAKATFVLEIDEDNYIEFGRKITPTDPPGPIPATDSLFIRAVSKGCEVKERTIDYPANLDEKFFTVKFIRNGDFITAAYWDPDIENYILFETIEGVLLGPVNVGMTFVTTKILFTNIMMQDFISFAEDRIVFNVTEPVNWLLAFQVSQGPILARPGLENPGNKITNSPDEVEVLIDGKQANICAVNGKLGEVTINTERQYDEALKEFIEPVVPNKDSIIEISYFSNLNLPDNSLRKHVFYKVTSIDSMGNESDRYITPAYNAAQWNAVGRSREHAHPHPGSVQEYPSILTYIFEESIRRNSWLRDQAGERVLTYLVKQIGEKCPCSKSDDVHRQPDKSCRKCWGSGIVGGYEGPFDVMISPLLAEQKVVWSDRGLRLDYQSEVWIGPLPALSQRDFIVRRDGTICMIGPITGPLIRGTIAQQHFNIQPLDRSTQSPDIKYLFLDHKARGDEPLTPTDQLVTDKGPSTAQVVKGRNLTVENQLY